MTIGAFDRTTATSTCSRTARTTCSSSAAASPGAAWRSTPPAAGLRTVLVERDDFASGTSSKSSKLVHGGLRYLQQGDIRLVYEALRERQRLLRNAPHLVKVMPFLIPMFGKDGVIHPKLARALGSAMWMYDLTGGARIGKLHKRISAEETLAHMPTLPAGARGGQLPLLRRPGRRRPPHPHHRPHRRRAARRGVREPRARGRADPDRRPGRRGAWSRSTGERSDGPGQGGRQRHRRVGRRGPHPRRGPRPGHDPAGQGHPSHRAVVAGAQRHRRRRAGPQGQALGVRRARGRRSTVASPSSPTSAPPTPTTTARSTTPSAPRDDVDYLLKAINHSTTTEITDDARRRHVGRSAAAGQGRRVGPHRRPLPSPRRHHLDGRDDHRHRRQAHHVPRDGRRHASTSSPTASTCPAPDAGPAPPGYACSAPTATTPGGTGATGHLHERFGGEARVLEVMIERDPSLGEPLVPGLPYLRAEALYAVRYEMARTLDDVVSPSHQGAAARTGRHRGGRRRHRRPSSGEELGWDRSTRVASRSTRSAPSPTGSARPPACPSRSCPSPASEPRPPRVTSGCRGPHGCAGRTPRWHGASASRAAHRGCVRRRRRARRSSHRRPAHG